jgi:hypothetical protein
MTFRAPLVLCLAFTATHAMASDQLKLPPEVTPALRAACESDVRRLCVGNNPTVESVRTCVLAKFLKLGKRCQIEIASAGLAP